jgi:hypothetical protein
VLLLLQRGNSQRHDNDRSSEPEAGLKQRKSYPEEFRSGGTKAGDVSRERISSAIAATQQCSASRKRRALWLDDLYQSANRLAHLYWLREVAGVDAWLVHLLFTDDHTHRPATREEWEETLPSVDQDLGLTSQSEFAAHAYLPALAPEELNREPARAVAR